MHWQTNTHQLNQSPTPTDYNVNIVITRFTLNIEHKLHCVCTITAFNLKLWESFSTQLIDYWIWKSRQSFVDTCTGVIMSRQVLCPSALPTDLSRNPCMDQIQKSDTKSDTERSDLREWYGELSAWKTRQRYSRHCIVTQFVYFQTSTSWQKCKLPW